MKKRKMAPIWHRFNGRMYSFATVEDLKRFQIHVANQATVDADQAALQAAMAVPEDVEGKLVSEEEWRATFKETAADHPPIYPYSSLSGEKALAEVLAEATAGTLWRRSVSDDGSEEGKPQ